MDVKVHTPKYSLGCDSRPNFGSDDRILAFYRLTALLMSNDQKQTIIEPEVEGFESVLRNSVCRGNEFWLILPFQSFVFINHARKWRKCSDQLTWKRMWRQVNIRIFILEQIWLQAGGRSIRCLMLPLRDTCRRRILHIYPIMYVDNIWTKGKHTRSFYTSEINCVPALISLIRIWLLCCCFLCKCKDVYTIRLALVGVHGSYRKGKRSLNFKPTGLRPRLFSANVFHNSW